MRLLPIFGIGRISPLEREISKLRQALQDLTVEKLIAEDRLRSALDDKSQLWGLMGKSIEDMKVAYQMHINLSWQKQGLPAPYPESPGIPSERQTSYQNPEHSEIPRNMLPSEAVSAVKKRFIDQYFRGGQAEVEN